VALTQDACAVFADSRYWEQAERELSGSGIELVKLEKNSPDGAIDWLLAHLPRGARLRTTSGNGDISVNANLAEARVSSGNGRVRVSGVSGRVDASSGNGEVSVDKAGGPVDARSGNGDVTIGTVNGPVNASSGNGDIRVSMDQLTGSEDMEFSSGNGRVEVVVPADFSAEVEANSGNGRITTDFPITIRGKLTPSRLRGTIGNGGRRLRMSTGNGSMEIRKRA